jgi:very-short-patch-repair endonuclease
LIIEIDGYSHQFKHEKDVERDKTLVVLGYTVLRFTEKEVLTDLENVIRGIEIYIQDKVNPPAPFAKGEQIN